MAYGVWHIGTPTSVAHTKLNKNKLCPFTTGDYMDDDDDGASGGGGWMVNDRQTEYDAFGIVRTGSIDTDTVTVNGIQSNTLSKLCKCHYHRCPMSIVQQQHTNQQIK